MLSRLAVFMAALVEAWKYSNSVVTLSGTSFTAQQVALLMDHEQY